MIILNSLKILEQLSEIEGLIQTIETFIEKNGMDVDKEKILEMLMTSRNKNSH